MWDSVQPHRWQPTRLPHPWDSPGKNTAVGCHFLLQCMKVKSESEVAQSCPTLRDPMDCSLPGSSIHQIFQARVLEHINIYTTHTPHTHPTVLFLWRFLTNTRIHYMILFKDFLLFALFYRYVCAVLCVSCVWLFATPWTVASQAPLSMEFSRQEYWTGLSFPSPGESSPPRDRTWVSCIAGRFFTIWVTREALLQVYW